MTVPVIAIDGPSGSGKGTIARQVAKRLGWHLLDSGALYRLVALSALKSGVEPGDTERLRQLAAGLDVRFVVDADGEEQIFLDGEDVTLDVRSEVCGNAASTVAAVPEVRDALIGRQRRFRNKPGLVADGRDMGTRIFTDAQPKIFLTASPEERAQRRHKQLKDKGIDVSLPALRSEIAERDRRDASRAVAPLEPAADAVRIDTTELGIAEVVDLVLHLANESGTITD